MDQFHLLSQILAGAIEPDENQFTDEMIKLAVIFYKEIIAGSLMVGPLDMAVLLRAILRREAEKQGGVLQGLKVPSGVPWPSTQDYQKCGVNVEEINDKYIIYAEPWEPDWKQPGTGGPLESPILIAEQRQDAKMVPGDPFLQAMGLDHYRSPGQRAAIRAILSAPPGATLVINLPTGSGKSLCVQLPALLKSKPLGVTVVIVPTIALGIDQENAIKPFVSHPTAYIGGEAPELQERRKGIIQRIRDGTQRILFTSPESMHYSLKEALIQCAKNNLLRMLVIDEAHILDQWGDEFRPAFQELSGLRKKLLDCCPGEKFVTVLLSATITENVLNTISVLFGKPGPVAMVSAVQLRPEPSYWSVYCETEEIKRERILDAVNHLPRPLILYTTKKEDAKAWQAILIQAGYKRMRLMHGDTNNQERLEILSQWREKKIDMVIATSAFGLGVDKDNVRVVLHACVPENIDRYYQEVGRGGRDGKASLSLMIYTRSDQVTAKDTNKRKIITIKKGLQRWNSMFSNKEVLGDGLYKIPINKPPAMDPEHINMENSYNESWNIRTLILMARSGLIELDAQSVFNNNMSSEEKDFAPAEKMNDGSKSENKFRIVRILDERHLQEQIWEKKVEGNRERTAASTKKGNRLLEEVLDQEKDPQKCIADIFSEVYTVNTGHLQIINGNAKISKSCGGCSYCRSQKREAYAGGNPDPRPIWKDTRYGSEQLQRLLGEEKVAAIFYRSRDEDLLHPESENVEKLIIWLLGQGARNIVAPAGKLHEWRNITGNIPDNYCFYFNKYEPLFMPKFPTILYFENGQEVNEEYYGLDSVLPRILILSDNTTDQERPGLFLIENFPRKKKTIREVLLEVGL